MNPDTFFESLKVECTVLSTNSTHLISERQQFIIASALPFKKVCNFRETKKVSRALKKLPAYAFPWPPLVTGLPGLYDNAASADACRWSVVTNAIRIHVKWAGL